MGSRERQEIERRKKNSYSIVSTQKIMNKKPKSKFSVYIHGIF